MIPLSSYKYYLYTVILLLVFYQRMIKTEQKTVSNQSKLIIDLINKVRLKMMSLGYSSHEAKHRILRQVRTSLKIKCDSTVNMERIMIAKIKSKGVSKKCFDVLVNQLDLLENSIQESDQSESEPLPIVKSEHVAPVSKEKIVVPDMAKSRIAQAKMRHYQHYRHLMGLQMEDTDEIKRFLLRRRKQLQYQKQLIQLHSMKR